MKRASAGIVLVALLVFFLASVAQTRDLNDGDIAVYYRLSCPDCRRYILPIRWILRGQHAVYIAGKKRQDPAITWVPSVVFVGEEKVIEIRNDRDLQVLKTEVDKWQKR